MVKPFLEPKTANKVKFVYPNDVESMKLMEDLFDMEQLESAFGGKSEMGFEINNYAERMREDDKRMPLFWTKGDTPIQQPSPKIVASSGSNSSSDHEASDRENGSLPTANGAGAESISEESMPETN